MTSSRINTPVAIMFTDIVGGNDGSGYTEGYMKAGLVPQFKLLQYGELIDLEGDIPSWENISFIWCQALLRLSHFQKHLAWIEPILIHLIQLLPLASLYQ